MAEICGSRWLYKQHLMRSERNILIPLVGLLTIFVFTSCIVENNDEAFQKIEFKNESDYLLEVNLPQGIMDAPSPRQFTLAPGELVGFTSKSPILIGPTRIDCDKGCGIKELQISIPDSLFTVRFLLDSCGAYNSTWKKDHFNPCCPAFWAPSETNREDLEIYRHTFTDSILEIAREYEVYWADCPEL